MRIDDDALDLWATLSDGDARRALMGLEVAVLSLQAERPSPTPQSPVPDPPLHVTLDVAEQSIQRKAVVYDATGDEHYDAASALIKSMRGSDPDAAVYWVARMLQAGEDPRFIARRIAILASEDIGLADPMAIQVAAAAYQITERVGMPECQLTLGQAAIYMATAPKSNAAAKAIWAAMKDVEEGPDDPGSPTPARRPLPRRQTARERRRLQVRPRRPAGVCRPGLPGGGQDVLRADGAGV